MMMKFVNAAVVIGDGTTMDNATVVIDGDRIAGVHRANERAAAGVAVDLEGRTLMPGMIDCHTHLWGGDRAMGLGSEAVSCRMDEPIARTAYATVEAARVTLNAGITTAREVAARGYIDVMLRDAQRSGQVDAPRIIACGPGIFMTGGHGSFLEPENAADGVEAVVRRTRQLVENGVDWIKVISIDGPEIAGRWDSVQSTYEEVAAAFAEARRLCRRTLAHAMGSEGIDNAVRAGVDTLEHGWYISEENCNLMLEKGTYFTPTASNVFDIIERGPALQMPWAEMMAVEGAGIMDRHSMAVSLGVKVIMGSDCGGNEARLHGTNAGELGHLVRCGMTASEAIVAATSRAAEALGLSEQVGTISAGKLADLVIVDGDPLSDIGLTVSGVVGVLQGARVYRDDLGLLDEVRRITTPARTRTSRALDV